MKWGMNYKFGGRCPLGVVVIERQCERGNFHEVVGVVLNFVCDAARVNHYGITVLQVSFVME